MENTQMFRSFIFLIFLIFFSSYSALTMELNPLLNLSNVAKIYNNNVDMNLTSKLLPNDSIGHEIGVGLTPEEVDNYFFGIETEVLSLLPEKVQKIYKLLRTSGLVRDVDALYVKKFLKTNNTPKPLLTFKQKLLKLYHNSGIDIGMIDEEAKFSVIKHDSISRYYFDESRTGIILRKKNATFGPEIREAQFLFQEQGPSKKLLDDVIKINNEIKVRLIEIQKIVNEPKDPAEILSNLITSDIVPAIYINQLQKLKRNKYLIQSVKENIADALDKLKNRQDSIEKFVIACPFDIFLLYWFFFFEEARNNLYQFQSYEYLDIGNAFSDIEELSIVKCLSENAQNVIEILGISVEEKATAKKTSKNISPSPISKKAVNKKKPKSKTYSTPKNNVARDEQNVKAPEKDQETFAQKSAEQKDTKDKITTCPINTDNRPCLNSLNDNKNPQNLCIKLEKVHRLLDTCARLLAREMALGAKNASGSVSLALVNEQGVYKLLISTKNNRANKDAISSLQNVLYYSNKFAQQISDIPGFIRTQKIALKKTQYSIGIGEDDTSLQDFIKQQKQLRQEIDKLKLSTSLYSKGEKTPIERNLINILLNPNSNNTIVLDNPFDYHSELNAISYILEHDLYLDRVKNSQGMLVPYQYIGGSMLTCAKCKALISGQKDIVGINNWSDPYNISIFTRGHYKSGYPCFTLPEWAVAANKTSRQILGTRLDGISVPSRKLPNNELFKIQEADLSDSDGE